MKKGQFFLAGMLLLGLTLLTLGFSTFEFDTRQEGRYTFSNIEQTVPRAAEKFSEYRGREFMESVQFFSINHRQNAEVAGNKLEMTVVAGFQEGQQLDVYTGNFRGSGQQISVEVNGDNISNRLKGDKIVSNTTDVAQNYIVEISSEHFEDSFNATGSSFVIIAYRYESEGASRQDTYTS